MVKKLETTFNAIVLSSLPEQDFLRIKDSQNIILSVSSFGWWAALLSNAKYIYHPLAGNFHPQIRKNQNFIMNDRDGFIKIGINIKGKWDGIYTQGNPSWMCNKDNIRTKLLYI